MPLGSKMRKAGYSVAGALGLSLTDAGSTDKNDVMLTKADLSQIFSYLRQHAAHPVHAATYKASAYGANLSGYGNNAADFLRSKADGYSMAISLNVQNYAQSLLNALGDDGKWPFRLQSMGNSCLNAIRALSQNGNYYQQCSGPECGSEVQALNSKLNAITLNNTGDIGAHYGLMGNVAHACAGAFANFTHSLIINETTVPFAMKAITVISALSSPGS